MSTIADDAVNIPPTSTGPKTEAGLESPLRRESLYAARDFIREGEEEEYAQTLIKLMDELTPEGVIEQTFATEIMGAHWRLRRCRLVEESFSSIGDLDCDPMLDERTEKQQKSVDRARAQSLLVLRRCLAELRNLRKGPAIHDGRSGQKPTPEPPVQKEWTLVWVSSKDELPPNATGNTASVRFVTMPRQPVPQPIRFVKSPNSPPTTPLVAVTGQGAAVPEQNSGAAAGTYAPSVLNQAA